jgi:hypothetical protein
MKKQLVIIIACLAALCAVACAVLLYNHHREDTRILYPEEKANTHPTDGPGYYVDNIFHADSMLVGKWQNADNPQWYKAYYDDYDEEAKLFWGKEWDEREDVMEEDLNYHGNGWFRWTKIGNALLEFATMDNRDVPIHREFRLRSPISDSLIYIEPDYPKIVFRFYKTKE